MTVMNTCSRCGQTPHEIFDITISKEYLDTGEVVQGAVPICHSCAEDMKKALSMLTSSEKGLMMTGVRFIFASADPIPSS